MILHGPQHVELNGTHTRTKDDAVRWIFGHEFHKRLHVTRLIRFDVGNVQMMQLDPGPGWPRFMLDLPVPVHAIFARVDKVTLSGPAGKILFYCYFLLLVP